uniref:Uncharacterized protein n=1 Tax=Arundo donax TaxID=35708 RepID=A0A0A9AUH0_ARUDO
MHVHSFTEILQDDSSFQEAQTQHIYFYVGLTFKDGLTC